MHQFSDFTTKIFLFLAKSYDFCFVFLLVISLYLRKLFKYFLLFDDLACVEQKNIEIPKFVQSFIFGY